MATTHDGVYRREDREGYWIQWMDPDGKRHVRKSNSRYLAGARRERELYLSGEHPDQKAAQARTCKIDFEQVATKFLEHQKPRLTPKGYEREQTIMAHFNAFFLGRLTEITSGQVSGYVTMRLGKVSKASVHKELISLKHLFRLAYDEWELLPEDHPNPTRKIKSPEGHDKKRTRYLTPAEFCLVLDHCPNWLRPLVGLATATGMRRSELLGLRWLDVVGDYVVLPDSKNGDPRPVRLNVFARQVIASLPPSKATDILFPNIAPEQVSMCFLRVCRDAGVYDFRFHDLRHTHATWLRQRGTELDVIADQLGHRDLRMTQRYAKVASVQVRDAVDGLDSFFDATRYRSATRGIGEGEEIAVTA